MKGFVSVISFLGFLLLFLALLCGLAAGLLFIFPDMSIMGLKAVNQRDTQIVYKDIDLASAFASGNFIIESQGTDIEIVMQKESQAGEGTIVVNESASGISFNSLSRTLVEWTETVVGNERYFKLKILEPYGMIFRPFNESTKVYINLEHTTSEFNFILQTIDSNVRFSYGDVQAVDTTNLNIDTLRVDNALSVTLPAYDTLSLNNFISNDDKINVNCGANVNKNVSITGDDGEYNFDKIGGDVTVAGNKNVFYAETVGNVSYTNQSGKLSLVEADQVLVKTSGAGVSIKTVNDGLTMTTDTGSLNVTNIEAGGLIFTANDTANVRVDKLNGSAVVRNSGVGSINLGNVNGYVDIISKESSGGSINVSMISGINNSVKILGYDGNINVSNISGNVDISVYNPGTAGSAGRANINASFSLITDSADNRIVAGGYANSPSGVASVEVSLITGWNNFDLLLSGATSAYYNSTKLSNSNNAIRGEAGGTLGKLYVFTPANFRLIG